MCENLLNCIASTTAENDRLKFELNFLFNMLHKSNFYQDKIILLIDRRDYGYTVRNIGKIYRFRVFVSNFREMTLQWLQNGCPKKFLSKYKRIIYIALKHMIRRFRLCNYFCEIFKFHDFMNT